MLAVRARSMLGRDSSRWPRAGWWVPASHSSSADAPGSHLVPARHSMHAVPFAAGWWLPAKHLAQRGCPSIAVKVPGAHSAGSLAPTAHALPAGHGTQLVCVRLGW